MNGYNSSQKLIKTRIMNYQPNNLQIPDSIDWRTKGYVTYVKGNYILFFSLIKFLQRSGTMWVMLGILSCCFIRRPTL